MMTTEWVVDGGSNPPNSTNLFFYWGCFGFDRAAEGSLTMRQVKVVKWHKNKVIAANDDNYADERDVISFSAEEYTVDELYGIAA